MMSKSFDIKLANIIGREQIIRFYDQLLGKPGVSVMFLSGKGGIGKTRLLEYLNDQALKKPREKVFVFKSPVDLYHFHYHDPERLMRFLANQVPLGEAAFENYRNSISDLESARLAGNTLQAARKLSETQKAFIEGAVELSKKRKIVLFLDTAENWVYAADPEEANKSIWAIAPAWHWLKELLIPLVDASIIVSGRERIKVLEGDARQAGLPVEDQDLGPFEFADTREYVRSIAQQNHIVELEEAEIEILHAWSQGLPILLAMYLEYYLNAPDSVLPSKFTKDDRSFEEKIISMYMTRNDLRDILPALGRAPKGVDAKLLANLLNIPMARAQDRLDDFKRFAFAKPHTLPGERERMFLHDVLYDMLEEYVLSEDPLANQKAYSAVDAYYEAENLICIDELKGILDQAMIASQPEEVNLAALTDWNTFRYTLYAERLFYELRYNFRHGQEMFGRHIHEAIGSQAPEGVILLHTEMSACLALEKFHHPAQISSQEHLFLETYLRLVPAQKALAEGNYTIAAEWIDTLKGTVQKIAALSPESQAVIDAILSTWLGFLKTSGNKIKEAEKELQKALDTLMQFPEVPAWLKWYQDYAYGLVYKYFGYLYSSQGRFSEALGMYQEALRYSRRTNLLIEEATIRNDMGFVLGEQGEFFEALENVLDAFDIRRNLLGLGRYMGLSINTQAMIAIQEGRYQEAAEFAKKSLALFNVLGDLFGKGLASIALAEANRRLAGSTHIFGRANRVRLLQTAERFAESAKEIFDADQNLPRLLEAYLEIGCANRDLIRRQEDLLPSHRDRLYRKALQSLQAAAEIAEQTNLEYRMVDSLTNIAWLAYFAERSDDEIGQAIQTALAAFPVEYNCLPALSAPSSEFSSANSLIWAQLGKVHVLKGIVALERWEKKQQGGDIGAAAEDFMLGLEYSSLFGKDYWGIRRGKRDIYKELKKLNETELVLFTQAVSQAEKKYGLSASQLKGFMLHRGIWID